MTNILTLVAPAPGLLSRCLADAELAPAEWLAPGLACDIPFAGEPADLPALIGPHPIDWALSPAAGRRKRLLIADMDSTIVTSETLDELAGEAGVKDLVAPITARAMNGEIDFKAALRERVALLKGLPLDALDRTLARTRLSPGAETLVRTMRAHGATALLVSGGFRFFTAHIARLAGFDRDESNELEVAGTALTGRVVEPILDKDAKLAALDRAAAALGLARADCVAVGDGANDLPMIEAAGLGVAYRAKPAVAVRARVRVDHADLTALLYFQGYRQDQFAG